MPDWRFDSGPVENVAFIASLADDLGEALIPLSPCFTFLPLLLLSRRRAFSIRLAVDDELMCSMTEAIESALSEKRLFEN